VCARGHLRDDGSWNEVDGREYWQVSLQQLHQRPWQQRFVANNIEVRIRNIERDAMASQTMLVYREGIFHQILLVPRLVGLAVNGNRA